MKVLLGYLLLLVCHWLAATHTSAEVYKWVDKDGKVNYGDSKTAKNAEDITASIKKSNIDTSTLEHQKLEALFRKENDADRAYKAEQARPNPKQEDHAARCAEGKKLLTKLEGRVVFVDKDGKPVRTTEQERKKRADEMRTTLAENCGLRITQVMKKPVQP